MREHSQCVEAYCAAVLAGEIVAGRYVRLAVERHLDDLEHAAERGLYFDAEIARRRSSANAQGGGAPDTDRLFDIPENLTMERKWVKRRVTPHPVGTQITPIRLSNSGSDGVPRTYVLCAGAPGRTPFMILADRLRDAPGWTYRELDTTHDAMVTMPAETAGLLIEAADGKGENDG